MFNIILIQLNKVCDHVESSLDAVEKTAIKDDYLSSQWEGIRQQLVLPVEKYVQNMSL